MIVPYLVGVVTAPLLAKIVKPVLWGVVKTTVGAALEVKKLASEAAGDVQNLIAEASTDFAVTETPSAVVATVPKAGTRTAGTRPGVSATAPK